MSTWRAMPLRVLYRRIEVSGRPDLPLLSVYRELGVVPREGREDNFNKASDDLSRYKVVRPGDLVVNKMKTWQGSLGVSAYTGIVSPAYFIGRRVGDVDDRFMHHLLRSKPLIAEYGARSKGIRPSQWDLPWEEFASIKVSVPSHVEQRAIADYLDAETARIDALIAKKRRLIELLGERESVGLATAVRGHTLGSPLRDSGLEWLGTIPAHWEVHRLKYVARLESGHTPSRTRPELWENCTTPWITLNDVGYLDSHEFVDKTVNLISEEGLAASSARVLPTGTVVLSRDATVGRCGILAEPMATSQHFVDWICSDALRPRFLWLLFKTVMQGHFASLTAGATLRTIGMPDVKQFVIPLPSLEEQDVIISESEVIRSRAARSVSALSMQVDLLVEHRQALITAAVTGEFSVPGVAA